VPLSPGVSDQPYMLGTAVVTSSVKVTFMCPDVRTEGAFEPGGAYSIYAGPVFPEDKRSTLHYKK
jgi:hypothetical protein